MDYINYIYRFSQSQLLDKYIQERNDIQFAYKLHQNWLILLMATFMLILSVVKDYHLFLIFTAIVLIVVIIRFRLKKECKKYDDVLILSIIVLLNVIVPTLDEYANGSNNTYFNGYLISYLTISCSGSLRFPLNVIVCVVPIFLNLAGYQQPAQPLWEKLILCILVMIFMLHYQFYEEMAMRYQYMQNYRQSIRKIAFNNYMFFRCLFNKKRQAIQLVEASTSGDVSQEENSDFVQMIRMMMINTNAIQTIRKIKFEETISLEQFIFYLLTDPTKLTNVSQDQRKFKFMGTIDGRQYQVSIYKYKCIEDEVFVTLKEMNPEDIINERNLRQFNMKSAKQQIDFLSKIIYNNFRVCLIYFQYLNTNYVSKFNQNRIYNCIHSKIQQGFNDYLNMEYMMKPNRSEIKIRIQSFDLLELIKRCSEIVKYTNMMKRRKFILSSNASDTFMISSIYKEVRQLVLNLMYFVSKECYSVRINLAKVAVEKYECYEVRFSYSKNITLQEFSKQPIVNPQSLNELEFNNELNLELAISILIAKKLGPYDRLFRSKTSQFAHSISFFIYTNYDNTMTQIPVISFKCANHIAKSSDLQKSSSLHYYDPLMYDAKQPQFDYLIGSPKLESQFF